MNNKVIFKKLPGVLSFQRLSIITDGLFYSVLEDGSRIPVKVVRQGIRGTQNVNGSTPKDVSNVQVTEFAKTNASATGVIVQFGLSFLPLSKAIFACAGQGDAAQQMREAVDGFISRSIGSAGLRDVANRYARNIFNGRWLWRNRLLGTNITVRVNVDNGKKVLEQDCLKTPLNDFDSFSAQEQELGGLILDCLEGNENHRFLVEAEISFGFQGAVEVFPSQNFVNNKPSGFARPLYKVEPSTIKRSSRAEDFQDMQEVGLAALRDQKIGNAIRTIDTWYGEYSSYGQPIPVEPLGASLDAQRFFRDKGDTSFKIMCRINSVDPDTDEGKFLLASLIRGGVYSESDKSSGAGSEN